MKRYQHVEFQVECFRADGEPYCFQLEYTPSGDHVTLQVSVRTQDNCNITGPKAWQYGRRWLLSSHEPTLDELVGTAYKAVEAFEIHELRERFKFHGAAIYNPHISVQALHYVAHLTAGERP